MNRIGQAAICLDVRGPFHPHGQRVCCTQGSKLEVGLLTNLRVCVPEVVSAKTCTLYFVLLCNAVIHTHVIHGDLSQIFPEGHSFTLMRNNIRIRHSEPFKVRLNCVKF
jgi:hypothetical protein